MISVAVATYNGEKYIKEQLDSIRTQTLPVDEVIICDDCSKDNTANIVNSFISDNNLTGWHFIEREKNLGFCMNFYDAIDRTTGDLIFLSDQDDRWYPEKVSEMVKLFGDSEVLSVASRHDLIDGNGKIISENPGIIFVEEKNDGSIEPITTESQIGCNWIRGCSMCIRKEIKDKITPIKLESLLSHDWLISIEASLRGKNLYLNKYLFSYRFHRNNASLSSVSRKSLIGNYEKRIRGLEQSISAYELLLANKSSYKNMTSEIESDIIKQISFEKLRLKYLKSNNPLLFLKLGGYISRYARYYGSKNGGIKIWLGDLSYANHKITSKIKKS